MKEELQRRYSIVEEGQGKKILLFIHGFASNQKTWQWVKEEFAETHKLVLLDLAGSGDSDKSLYDVKRYSTLQGYVEDLKEVLEVFQYQEVTVIGHSVGGLIGLLLAKAVPERIRKVMMIGASPRYLNEVPGYFGGFNEEEVYQVLDLMEENFPGWASYIAKVAVPEAEGLEHTAYVERNFRQSDPKITYHFLKVTLLGDHRAELQDVPVEVVILQCAKDSFVPMEVAEYMHGKLPDSKLHLLTARGHYPHISHPMETIETIRKYL